MSHSLRLFAANPSSTLDPDRSTACIFNRYKLLATSRSPKSRRSGAARRRIAANPFSPLASGLSTFFESPQKKSYNFSLSESQPFSFSPPSRYPPLFGVQSYRNINNSFLPPFISPFAFRFSLFLSLPCLLSSA